MRVWLNNKVNIRAQKRDRRPPLPLNIKMYLEEVEVVGT